MAFPGSSIELFYTSKIQNFDYENIFALKCTNEKGQTTKLYKVTTSHNRKFQGLAENANKSYHVYEVMVVLHIYNRMLVIRLPWGILQTNQRTNGPENAHVTIGQV